MKLQTETSQSGMVSCLELGEAWKLKSSSIILVYPSRHIPRTSSLTLAAGVAADKSNVWIIKSIRSLKLSEQLILPSAFEQQRRAQFHIITALCVLNG